jgi:hypothetical protein
MTPPRGIPPKRDHFEWLGGAKESDFRGPLLDNLRQALAGVIKPVKTGRKKGAAKRPVEKTKSAAN